MVVVVVVSKLLALFKVGKDHNIKPNRENTAFLLPFLQLSRLFIPLLLTELLRREVPSRTFLAQK